MNEVCNLPAYILANPGYFIVNGLAARREGAEASIS